MFRRAAAACTAASIALFGAGGAEAEAQPGQDAAAPAAGDGRTSYPAGFFAQFLPNNANDMILKTPGFTFSKGEDVRGFAGAAGNVLIDGMRPTSKSVPLDQLLQRISARSVERIEVIRGGAPGIDMQGQPVVANVVRVKGGESTTTLQVLPKPYQGGDPGFVTRLEQTLRYGSISADNLLGYRNERHDESGVGRLTRLGPGVSEAGRFENDTRQEAYQANGALEHRRPGGDLLHLSLGLDRSDIRRGEYGDPVSAVSGLTFSEHTNIKLRNDKGEVGGDYAHAFNGRLTGQVIGLRTLRKDVQRSQVGGRGAVQAAFEQSTANESIVRGVLTAAWPSGVKLEGGGEGALNTLDSASSLSVGGVPVAVPSANLRVEEKRGEAFGTFSARPWRRLSVELGARFEISTIRQFGGADRERTLSFVKPRLILTYTPRSDSQLRLRIERTVGQLNFKDFAASSALELGQVNAGNPDLLPERGWVFEAALEKRFWDAGSIVLAASHAEVGEVADLIPIRGFDAPGNIGDGRRQELRFSLTLPLDKLGVKNGQFRFNGTWRWSRVIDPVTGIERRISNQRPFEGDYYIGKRLPKLKSSINMDGVFGYSETSYRISEIRRIIDQPLSKIYWDWAPRSDLNFRFYVENVTAKDRKRLRTLFVGPRSNAVLNLKEERSAELKPLFMFRIRKTI